MEADTILTFKGHLDKYMNSMGLISHDLIEWRSRLEGPDGLLLLLVLMLGT